MASTTRRSEEFPWQSGVAEEIELAEPSFFFTRLARLRRGAAQFYGVASASARCSTGRRRRQRHGELVAEQAPLRGDTRFARGARLNLPPDVTYADAKRRYHALVKKLHPDKSNDDGTRAAFDRIRGAYIVVEEELRRREEIGGSSRIDAHDGSAAARTRTWQVTLLLAVIFTGLIWFTAETARDLSRPHHHHRRGTRPRAQIACTRTRTRTPARRQRRASPSSSSRRAA